MPIDVHPHVPTAEADEAGDDDTRTAFMEAHCVEDEQPGGRAVGRQLAAALRPERGVDCSKERQQEVSMEQGAGRPPRREASHDRNAKPRAGWRP